MALDEVPAPRPLTPRLHTSLVATLVLCGAVTISAVGVAARELLRAGPTVSGIEWAVTALLLFVAAAAAVAAFGAAHVLDAAEVAPDMGVDA